MFAISCSLPYLHLVNCLSFFRTGSCSLKDSKNLAQTIKTYFWSPVSGNLNRTILVLRSFYKWSKQPIFLSKQETILRLFD